MSELKPPIFSGEESRDLWEEIKRITAMSTGEDIHGVLYSIGCALQRLENRTRTGSSNDPGKTSDFYKALKNMRELDYDDAYNRDELQELFNAGKSVGMEKADKIGIPFAQRSVTASQYQDAIRKAKV